MGVINYDPDKTPHLDPKMVQEAKDSGMQLVHVICYPARNEPDEGGVDFITLSPGIPRIGEIVYLQDGKGCRVENVFWNVALIAPTGSPLLVPNIIAVRTSVVS